MKKLIALLLVAVMCLSFVACDESGTAETPSNGENTENNGGSTSNTTTNENDSTNDGITDAEDSSNDTTNGDETTNNSFIYQEWREIASGGTLIFDKDGNMHIEGETYKYKYDKELEMISVFYHQTINMKVVFEEDTYKLKLAGEVYVPATIYEKFHSSYVEQKKAKAIEGKTELEIGNTYNTPSGVKFIFTKAEITGTDSCRFNVYLTYEGDLNVSKEAEYHNASINYSFFSFSQTPIQSEINTHCFSGGSQKMTKLETDHNEEFGILSFTIDGVEFYVSIDTFFE